MLQGKSPLIVFQFKDEIKALGNLAAKFGFKKTYIPRPLIPVYLDEQLVDVVFDDLTHSMAISGDADSLTEYQKPISNDVKMTIKARKDNVLVTALLALFETVYEKAASNEYRIILFYDTVFLKNATLRSLAVSTEGDSDLRRIDIVLGQGSKPVASTGIQINRVGGTPFTPAV